MPDPGQVVVANTTPTIALAIAEQLDLLGFQIVMAKFWWLRLSEGHRRLEVSRLLSDTVVPNELMRQCFMRR
jgi:hypothetical protein